MLEISQPSGKVGLIHTIQKYEQKNIGRSSIPASAFSENPLLNPGIKFDFFWPRAFFRSIVKETIRKNIHNMSQGPPNPGFMQENVQKGDFLKKSSRELKNYFCFRFL